MKRILKKLKNLFAPKKRHNLIYCNAKGKTRLYIIGDPLNKSTFGNERENDPNVGFRSRVLNRGGRVRSFRYDRIVSLTS